MYLLITVLLPIKYVPMAISQSTTNPFALRKIEAYLTRRTHFWLPQLYFYRIQRP